MGSGNGFTPVQQRILNVLADGRAHKTVELLNCINDELCDKRTLRVYISRIRKKLPANEAIVCELRERTSHYRHVRLLAHDH